MRVSSGRIVKAREDLDPSYVFTLSDGWSAHGVKAVPSSLARK